MTAPRLKPVEALPTSAQLSEQGRAEDERCDTYEHCPVNEYLSVNCSGATQETED